MVADSPVNYNRNSLGTIMTTKQKPGIYPKRVKALSGVQRHRAELAYLVRLFALHHNPQGSMMKMSTEMGMNKHTLRQMAHRGYLTPGIIDAMIKASPKTGITKDELSRFKV